MKKVVFCSLLLLVFLFVYTANAEITVRHYIPEGEFSLKIPISILCIEQNADETNGFFQNEFFDYATLHQYMLDNNIYLYGMTTDFLAEFAVRIDDYYIEDFEHVDNYSLMMVENLLKSTYVSMGASNVTSDIYEGSTKKAVRIRYLLPSDEIDQYVEFYFFTHKNKIVMIRFISFFNPISEIQEKMIQDIIETAVWEKEDLIPGEKGATDQGIYTDYETGVSFSVPSNWNEVRFVSTGEGKKVKYRIGTDNVWVLYESGDFWDFAVDYYGPLTDIGVITRKDIGNDMLSIEQVAATLGCNESDITMQTINGQEYYCMNTSFPVSSGLFSGEAQNILYICVKDAYIYWFQLSGTDIGKYENDFIKFMETVVYP